MVIVPAFKDGSRALQANPVLLVAGFLMAVGSHLQTAGEVIEAPIPSAAISLAWLLVAPFVLGGFIGCARAAIQGTETSLGQFVTMARTHYVRLVLGTVLFVLIVMSAAVGSSLVSFVVGVGVVVLGGLDGTPAFVTMIGSTLVWLVCVLVVLLFVQFYGTAIVIEDESATDAFRRSVRIVRSNLRSVVSFSLLWVILLNVFLMPEYLVRSMLADDTVAELLPTGLGVPIDVLLPVGIVLSTIGFSYFYTVYTAYYVRLIADSPAAPEPA